ncbi:uncharacterized protein LOC111088892 [Limulus polyphemus]|uniref:Uncharacterized protein LOC111088892 n=1 Tax=Limulus polyphemus TaxID=6850 RepID=A0ABM1TIX3_LIMPO|nr:uncharacterized protein LOC111088892 [Limulus polyphemus]
MALQLSCQRQTCPDTDQFGESPQCVRTEKINQHSFTIVWKRPVLSYNKNHKLLAFSISCFLLGEANPAEERQIVLPPIATSKEIQDLREGTKYEVVVWAVYLGNRRIAAPSTIIETQFSIATEKHVLPENSSFLEKECNCTTHGTAACTRIHSIAKCTCFPGFTGDWCEYCVHGYFRDKKRCRKCPCTNATSSGECITGELEEIKCKMCLPGHRGRLCSSCTAGYRWNNDSCVPSNCFSFPLCMKNKDHPGCSDCVFLTDRLPPSTGHNNSEGTAADGTVPLIGVIVILGIILLTAVGATGYHSWSQPHLHMRDKEQANDKKTLDNNFITSNKHVSIQQTASAHEMFKKPSLVNV